MFRRPPFRTIRPFLIALFISGLLLSAPALVVQAQISFPAEINKSFSPISIVAGQTSRLSVTIFNPNGFQLINVGWTDNLAGVQPGIRIANPVNLTNTCGGTVTAAAGSTTFSLSGGSVPAQAGVSPGSCTVSIDVTSTTPDNLVNTIPAGELSSTDPSGAIHISNTSPASATLRVGSVQTPSLSKSFSPNTIWVGQSSQLAITVRNNDLNTALTQTTLTDNLPANVVLANPVSASLTGCGAGASLTGPGGLALAPGDTSVTLNNGTVSANSTCVIRVNVTSTVQAVYTNTIPAGPGSIQTQQGVTNSSAASAPINVQAIGISKVFSPTSFQAGGTSTLRITLQNPSATPYTGVSISDTLPGTVLTVVPGTETTTCGGTVSTTLPRTVTLAGGTIPASLTPPTPVGSCLITVQVTSPSTATAATYTNTIPANTMTTTQGATNLLAATANIGVYASGTGVTGSKSFSPTPIFSGGNSRLRIDINAPADTSLTNFAITDVLPAGLTISNSTAPSRTGCGSGTLTAVTGTDTITLTGGIINPGTVCRIDVYVTAATPGVYSNVIPPANITNTQGRTTSSNISASLTVQAASDLMVSKAFFPGMVNPNGLSTLTITLRNTNTSPLVNVSLLDVLPGSTANGVVVAPAPNASTTCTSGGSEVLTATPGTQSISLTNGTVPAQVGTVPGICTINVNVQGRGSAATRTNTIPIANVSGTIQGTGTVINPQSAASANLVIGNLTLGVVKGFNPLTVFGGSASTMSIQLVNPNNAVLSGIAFTDNMPAGMIIANPANLNTGSCGGTLTGTPGAASFSFSGGSLAASMSCTLTLSITMTVNGNLTNVIPAGAVTTFNGVSNPSPAEASLTNLPGASVSKFFSPNPIPAGTANYSSLTITIQNTSSFPFTGLGLSDVLPGSLPAGLEIAGGSAPASSNTCGGTLTAAPGTQTIQLTGGSLAGNSSCTIVVPVTSTTPGSYVNTIPAAALLNSEGATNNQPASDTLVVVAAPSISKSFGAASIALNGTTTLQFTITNPDPATTLTGIAFTDTLPAGLVVATPSGLTGSCGGGTITAAGGSASVGLSGAALAPGDSCTFSVEVLGATPGTKDNSVTVTSANGGTGNTANATLTVLAPTSTPTNTATSTPTGTTSTPPATATQTPTPTGIPSLFDPPFSLKTFDESGLPLLQWTMVWINNSNTLAINSVVSDAIPAGTTYVASGAASGFAVPVSAPADSTNIGVSCTETSALTTTTLCYYEGPTGAFPRGRILWAGALGPDPGATGAADADHEITITFRVDVGDDTNRAQNTATVDTDLNNDGDMTDPGEQQVASASATWRQTLPRRLPSTGFAPNRVTDMSQASREMYLLTGAITLEIPALKVKIPVVGVPLRNGDWNVAWLGRQAGWLEGTAFPSWKGNSVLTGHVYLPNGLPGPFVNLSRLRYGERIIVHAYGERYIFEVQTNALVEPDDMSALKHEKQPWLTLITCKEYDEKTDTYRKRVVVRAVLVSVNGE